MSVSTDPYFVLADYMNQKVTDETLSREEMISICRNLGMQLIPIERDRGDGRKAHYGDGKQPWDTCLEDGIAQHGAYFSILRYLRRSKQPERDHNAARVYYRWLKLLAMLDKGDPLFSVDNWKELSGTVNLLDIGSGGSLRMFRTLVRLRLSEEERTILGVTAEDLVY